MRGPRIKKEGPDSQRGVEDGRIAKREKILPVEHNQGRGKCIKDFHTGKIGKAGD